MSEDKVTQEQGPILDPDVIRAELEKFVLKEDGLDRLKNMVGGNLCRMVAGTRALSSGAFHDLFAEGYDAFTSPFITVGAEVLLAHTEGSERDQLQADYDYWKANMARIMELHHITL